MRYPQLATRLFGVPLMIERNKLDIILAAIAPRLGIEVEGEDAKVYGPGDNGKSRKDYYVTEDGIGVIDIVGPLVKRQSGGFLSGGPTTYGQIESEFMDAATDPAIKGILLQVDSPGGEATGCFELADMIYGQRGAKPIFAAVDGDAFSAAYALASSAEQLFVTKTGGVGSVGVWMMHVDQSAYNEKEGFRPTYIFAGARKIDGNPHGPLTKEAESVFQNIVDGSYEMFADAVARNRGMSAKAVRATEAGLFWGQPKRGEPSAVDVGFADQVGTVNDALAALRERIKTSSSKVAVSATNPTKREAKMAEQQETTGTEKQPAEKPDAAALAAAKAEGFAAGFGHAVQIVGLAALGGFTAKQTQPFLKADASIENVQQELTEARAGASGPEIHSHILPGDGASGKNSAASAMEQAADRLAQQDAARKGAK